jgi:uncharacterized protein YndB with AHSA1/START domain
MSVKKEENGRRSIAVEVEVPGTPEEVWKAIATGPGISSWFVPTEVREDGTTVMNFGPGMDSVATRTAWDPPHRFAAESDGMGPNAPKLATEWVVEARSGGTCIVRVVHSLFASTDDWDGQLTGMESGWPAFFRVLRMYLANFAGQGASRVDVVAFTQGDMPAAWSKLTGSLGLDAVAAGERVQARAGRPVLGGVVEEFRDGANPFVMLMLEEPARGAAVLNGCKFGGQLYLSIVLYLYGETAEGAVARDKALWEAWMGGMFPSTVTAETPA